MAKKVLTKQVRVFVGVMVMLATMGLSGCGHYVCHTTLGNATCTPSGGGLGQGGTITETAFVYFVDPSASQMALEGLNVANSQTYAPVSSFVTPTVNVGLNAVGMAVVQKKYLYLTSDAPDLYAFTIDGTSGALANIGSSPYLIAGGTIATDPKGLFVFVGSAAGIHQFAVSQTDGSLSEVAGSPFSNGGVEPAQMVTDGLGKYLYAVGANEITQFSYQTGLLVPVTPSSITASMSMIASERTGAYILGITGATAEVSVFTIGSGGALTGPAQSPTMNAPDYLAVDPTGAYVYTFNQSSFGPLATLEPMEGYILESNGSLTALSTSPFTGLNAGIGLFDQSGQYLFTVAQLTTSSIAEQFAYSVDTSTGAVGSTLPAAGAAGPYVVTDAP